MSRDNWLLAAPHRTVVTEMLMRPKSGGSLALLGAGNCNDLDLPLLLGAFENIHLIDLDGESLVWGVGHQGVANDARLSLHGGVDLSGIADAVAPWSPATPPSDREVDDFVARAGTSPLPDLPGACAVVASVCLLTQMLEPIINGLGQQHPQFLDVLGTVRRRHLQLLAELCAPGGTVVLVTDVVSSTTCPELATILESQLADFVGRQIQQHNFFTGVNPFVLRQLFETDAAVSPLVSDVRLSLPWRWQLGPRSYAVVALTARRCEAQ